VADYQVYAGPTPAAMTLRSTQPRTGFETSSTLAGAASQVCYVQVVARDAAAVELSRSALLPVTPSCGMSRLFVPMISSGT
jgi:hypothetical protein